MTGIYRTYSEVPAFLALLGAGALVVALFANVPNSALVALAVAPFLLYMSLSAPPSLGLEISREFDPPRVFEGQDATIVLRVENKSGDDIEMVEVFDRLPRGLALIEGAHHFVVSLRKGEAAVVKYRVHCAEPGLYPFEGFRLRVRDYMGVRLQEADRAGWRYLLALPKAEEVKRRIHPPRPKNLQIGEIPSRVAGLGVEFFSLREYSDGDDFRRINWKASARARRLISNEYEWEKPIDGYLILDARDFSSSVLTEMKRVAASTIINILGWKNRLGLIVFSHVVQNIEPESGSRQAMRLLEMVAEAKAMRAQVFEYQAERAFRLLLRNRQAIVVTPLVDHEMASFVGRLKGSGLDPIIIAVSAKSSGDRLSSELFRLSRLNSKMQLMQYGTKIIEWTEGDPFIKAVEEIQKWRRGE